MEIRRRTAAAMAGLVVLLGGLAAGCAATADSGIPAAPAGQDGGGPGGRPPGGDFDTSALVTALADGLGLDEATVKTAVEEALAARTGGGGRPSGEPSGMPTGEPPTAAPDGSGGGQRGEGMAQRIAAAIAEKLGVDEAEVLPIVQQNLPGAGDRPDQQQPSAASTP
ncbi:MAG: hypothetical protein QM804_07765 [Propionicimonas sp.]